MLTILSAGLIKLYGILSILAERWPVVREILCCHLRTTSE